MLPFSADSVNLVDEDDAGAMLVRHPEELPDQLGAVSKVLLDQLAANHPGEEVDVMAVQRTRIMCKVQQRAGYNNVQGTPSEQVTPISKI